MAAAQQTLARKPSFFKVLIEQDYNLVMRIPPAFLKRLHGKSLERSTLTRHIGGVWPVKVARESDGVYFSDGWQKFIKDNKVEFGDFLLFKYDGKLSFEVDVYGKTCCEKEVHAEMMQNEVVQKEEVPNEVVQREVVQVQCGEKDIKVSHVCQCKFISEHKMKNSSASTKKNCGKNQSKKRTDPSTSSSSNYELEKKMVFNSSSCPFKIKHPHFTLRWRSCKGYAIRIQKIFAKAYDLESKSSMNLCDSSGKLWPVIINHLSDGRAEFGQGWHDFCIGNKLQEGDRCIFEFLNLDMVRVHIIRTIAEMSSTEESVS